MAKNAQTKRALIDKTNQVIVFVTAAAAFITVFSLIADRTLFNQYSYQSRIITQKKKAQAQLKTDIANVAQLDNSYQALESTPQNIIGGSPTGSGTNSGDNASIILDALPAQYDFPALATSLNKIISGQGFTSPSISGSDEELTQEGNQYSALPVPVAIPFSIGVTGSYSSVQTLIDTFQKSIRPFQITNISLSGTDATMQLTMSAQTYYQPSKIFKISSETVK